MESYPRFLPSGDCGLVVEFEEEIARTVNDKVLALQAYLMQANPRVFRELIPSYRALLVEYDPLYITYQKLEAYLHHACEQARNSTPQPLELIIIPTVYGGEFGADLSFVASYNSLTPEDVIAIHSSVDYPVYMIGFTPGFPYLGGLDSRIACPRRATPRMKIVAGSIGIAGNQTGIYPLDSPGGWQIIGHTSLQLFSPEREPAVLLRPGNLVRFVPV